MKTFIVLLTSVLIVPGMSNGQWVRTNGPYGGRIEFLASNNLNLFAGTPDGIYRTSDVGASWTLVNNSWPKSDLMGLVVTGTNLFAGTRDHGVYRSTDNGLTWTTSNSGLTNLFIRRLDAVGDDLFVKTEWDLQRSTDQGDTWIPANVPVSIRSITKSDSSIFIGWSFGILRSDDDGASWHDPSGGSFTAGVDQIAVNGPDLYAGSQGRGIFRSTDDGTSWNHLTDGLTDSVIQSLAVDGSFVYTGTFNDGLFISSNNGLTWSPADDPAMMTGWIAPITMHAGSVFAAAQPGIVASIYRSMDHGASWNPVHDGMMNTYVDDFSIDGENLYAGTWTGCFRTSNGGASWIALNDGLTTPSIHEFATVGGTLFAATDGGVFRSSDGGLGWTEVSAGLPANGIEALTVDGTDLFVGTWGAGVYRSTDDGNSWSPANVGIPYARVASLQVSGPNLLAGTLDAGIHLSTDGGQSWTNVMTPWTAGAIWSFAGEGNTVFAGTYGGVHRSMDNGMSWAATSMGLTNQYVTALVVSGQMVFAGTYGGGCFISTDNGAHWSEKNSGLTNPEIYALSVHNGNLYAGTVGSGVWKRPVTDLGLVSSVSLSGSWNLVSLPVIVADNRKDSVFPAAISAAFAFDDGYVSCDTLRNGIGYWLKYPADAVADMGDGNYVMAETVDVHPGWNLIGSISVAVPVDEITSDSSSLTTGSFFGYDEGYTASDTLYPGKGYWVKVNQTGNLIVSMGGQAGRSKRITILPTEERPPEPPGGVVSENASTVPVEYGLSQNYPNPFNPTTTIRYTLPEIEHVKLVVFNMLGQEVRELVNEIQVPGYKIVSFDARNLPSGVYTFRITAGSFTDVRKMLLLR